MLYWIEDDDLSVLTLGPRQGNGQERQRQRGKQGRKHGLGNSEGRSCVYINTHPEGGDPLAIRAASSVLNRRLFQMASQG